jgi:hypothetical protein
MPRSTALLATICLLIAPPVLEVAYAQQEVASSPNAVINCGRRDLRDAIAAVRSEPATIRFTGVCDGPIVIRNDGVTLRGVGRAIIDGNGDDALVVRGASEIQLVDFEVRNGTNGIVGVNGAHLTIRGVQVHDNKVFGISLQTGSSARLADVTTTNNGLHGLDLQTGSAVSIEGAVTSSGNRVFGVNVNGSSLTLARGNLSASRNAVGVQIATSANAFLNDPESVITVADNLATGLTVVSGAHLVSFGGTIVATGNGAVGVSVNSKAGLDLDAGSTLRSTGNGEGVLIQEGSVVTVFNNPQFSGVPGFSTIETAGNRQNGIRVLTDSTLTLSNQARITSTQNLDTGLLADAGAGLTLVNSSITGNGRRDLQLTFGTHADVQTTSFGTASCDATVLVRGTGGLTCPR